MIEDILLSDRYRLAERLATGGMGEIWRAMDEVLGRAVAVKVLRPEYVSDEGARQRFASEARFAASLHHPGIAQVYDFGEHYVDAETFPGIPPATFSYLVMELVEGEPLSEILARGGPLSSEVTLDIVGQAARALHAAHTAGIVHRDIKPANLIVSAGGTVKITDFGIAKAVKGSTSLTQTNMVMGTAHYVAPEQASGQPVTAASDLYALGVVAYQCLAGRLPFDAENAVAVALMHVRTPPEPLPPDIPAPIRELTGQLLAKDPAARPGSAQEVADRAYVIRETLALGGAVAPGLTEPPSVRTDELATRIDSPAEGNTAGLELPGTDPADVLPEAGPDNASGKRQSTVLLVASVGAAILVLGFILLGNTLLSGSADPKPIEHTDQDVPPAPAASQTTRQTRDATTAPASPTTAVPSPSTTGTPQPTPTNSTTRPTPSPTSPTVSPSPSSPKPSPTETGE